MCTSTRCRLEEKWLEDELERLNLKHQLCPLKTRDCMELSSLKLHHEHASSPSSESSNGDRTARSTWQLRLCSLFCFLPIVNHVCSPSPTALATVRTVVRSAQLSSATVTEISSQAQSQLSPIRNTLHPPYHLAQKHNTPCNCIHIQGIYGRTP